MSIRNSRATGFTLFEIIAFIVIIAVAFTGIATLYVNAVRGSSDPLVQKQAIAIAESMMDEILLLPFANPSGGYNGPLAAPNQDRTQCDDVSDYAGYNTALQTPTGIKTVEGTAIAALTGYNVQVTVAPTAFTAATPNVAAADSKLITVTATGPNGVSFTLDGWKFNYP